MQISKQVCSKFVALLRRSRTVYLLSGLCLLLQGAAAAAQPASSSEVHDYDGYSIEVRSPAVFTVQINDPIRLEHVLSSVNGLFMVANPDSAQPYWPTAVLVDKSVQGDVDALQERVVSDLRSLAEYYRDNGSNTHAESVQALAGRVLAWRLGHQPLDSLSLEMSRLRIADNPLLRSGEYEIILGRRPEFVSIDGLIDLPGKAAISPGSAIRPYVTQSAPIGDLADANKVYVKSQTDKLEAVGWGYYNADSRALMPGELVFVPFAKRRLPRDFKHLSDDMTRLVEYWVPQLEDNAEPRPPVEAVDALTNPESWVNQSGQLAFSRDIFSGNYGGVGLMQTPTARMQDNGYTGVSYFDMDIYRRYSVNIQLFDWLETTAFYLRVPGVPYSNFPGFSNDNIYTDKGFDIKARLIRESYWIPEVSVGLRDFAGTGLFDGEFVVANKAFGPFDVSLGIGFGRLGSRDNISNPLCEVGERFCERADGFTRGGGQFEYDQWFRGPAALFGGVQYTTPVDGLSFVLEYDGNDFSKEKEGVDVDVDSSINFGVNYRLTDWFDLHASYQRGNALTLGFTAYTNIATMSQVRVEREPVRARPEPRESNLADVEWERLPQQIRRQGTLANARVRLSDDDQDGQTVTFYGEPMRYRDPHEQADRTARVMAAELPRSVETFEIVENIAFEPGVSTKVNAELFRQRINHEDIDKGVDTKDLFVRSDPESRPESDDPSWRYNPEYRYTPNFGVRPFFHQDFGSPETFHFYQLGAAAFSNYWVTPKIELFGEVAFNIANNYDRFNFTSGNPFDLPVPQVRTLVREYARNDYWLEALQATYIERLAPNIHSMAYAGILERMYAGYGGEVIYRPLDKPWAVGFDVTHVRQRDFSGALGFRDYETVTGFASIYYQMPWLEDSMLQVDVGRFLAKDWGVNVTFQRRFENGVIVGAFAAKTDISTEDFGEGAFNKGFFVNIPFDLVGVRATRQRIGMSWVPLTRDGGQKLIRRSNLYQLTDARSPFYHR